MKITVSLKPHHDWFSDMITSGLGEIGFESFVETETGFEAYIPVIYYNESNLEKILSNQPGDVTISWNKEFIAEKNWNEEWEKNYFSPLVIADQCLVRAPFHKNYPHCRFEIVIEPNMAFGTGHHETTSMMLEVILMEELKGKSVLDMGCGTGILGILADMKGASRVTAIDIDEWSVKGTLENAKLNNANNLEVKKGDARLLGNETYDVILANIHKNILMEDLPVYAKSLNKKGKLYMSGFYLDDLQDITTRATSFGLSVLKHYEKNKWVVAAFQL